PEAPSEPGTPAGPGAGSGSGATSESSALIDAFRRAEDFVHVRALRLLNLQAHERETQVHLMLANRQRGLVEYWTFLMLSMAIATLGLAMDSTTVVIGAMLVSPLMGPIVEFAMGLVVGSPVLTLRSTLRITGSVVAVVAGAWLITVVLPFQEITSEVAARTQPTLLDMALAVCVALAAALTTVKARSETNIVAAGAAIGIALVPPICVVGFGLGIGDPEVYVGAFLLLVTNFFAIIAVGVVSFYLLGYERVSVRPWDDEAMAAAPPRSLTRRVLGGVERVFGSRRTGLLFRFVLPVLLVAPVWRPLSAGLRQITWEAQTRAAVSEIMSEVESQYDEFDTEWSVSGERVSVSTYLVGSVATADSLRGRLETRIAAASGVQPDVEVNAMPNYSALQRAVEPRAREPEGAQDPPEIELARIRGEFAAALERTWPSSAYGALLGWHVQLGDAGSVELHIQHLGPEPDAGAGLLLGSVLGPQVPRRLTIRFDPIDTATVRAALEESVAWLPTLAQGVATAQEAQGVRVCVTLPDDSALQRAEGAQAVADATRALLEGLPRDRYILTATGDVFEMWLEPRAVGGSAAVTLPSSPRQPVDSAGLPGAEMPGAGEPGAGEPGAGGPSASSAVPSAPGPLAAVPDTTQAPPAGGACGR
ncbi:MAG: DUF389 domain-containing protein, partial [Gemmatimonadetes bacterium]|nr:DUF389 domain-containing protein [Gemmatimonadota bacterium]